MRKVERFEAHLDDYGLITIYLSNQFYNGQSSLFYLKKADKSLFKCQILSFELSSNDYNKYMIQTSEAISIGLDYEIIEEHGLKTYLQYSLITKTLRFDQEFYYEGNDLGVHPINNKTDFALWAPTASRVMVEIFKERSILIEMNKTEKGVYRASIHENGHGLAYLYHVYVNGGWRNSTDPIARSATSNNQRSVIVDYTQIPIKNYSHSLPKLKQSTDAIIYELSVRDFTAQLESKVNHRSQFLGLTELNTRNPEGGLTGLSYIKDLGVTHVQIMPMYDFATIDEDNPSVFYNWGYDPQQFNIPEGSYSSDPSRPLSRIGEAKQMIQAFHQQGIRVIMDVVYNHVYDMEASAFEKIVPYYYFRRSTTGAISNGSFCGNDIDSNRLMVRKMILDSCLCWMEAYDVDGFRFDLMGVLDIETMNAVVEQCHRLKPDSLIYGEGWSMPTILPEEIKANMINQAKMPLIGQFNDFFRDHVKGKTSHEDINVKGYCAGDTSYLSAMKSAMVGNSINDTLVKIFTSPTQSINYVECHDNHTSWDKLKEACKEDSREIRIKKHKLMIGSILLAQGIPFLHSGQEFCRTKNGMHNTYRSSDLINQIDWLRKERYIEVVNYTKDMIKLRKRLAILRLTTSAEIEEQIDFKELDGMLIIHYQCEIKDPYQEIWIYINPSDQIYYQSFPDYVEVIANEAGLIEGLSIQNATINPYTLIVFAR